MEPRRTSAVKRRAAWGATRMGFGPIRSSAISSTLGRLWGAGHGGGHRALIAGAQRDAREQP